MKVMASMIDDTTKHSDTYSRLYCRQRFATCVASPEAELDLSIIHISEPTRQADSS